MAHNTQNHDDVLELDTLKKFTIPKKERPARELLEPLSTKSREFQHEILPTIHGSFKDHDAEKRFQFRGAHLVHNSLLQNAYLERRKDMRQKGYGEKEMQDSFVFIMADSWLQAKRICSEGLKNGNTQISNLGNPELAVCVCKHADIISPTPLQYGHLCKLVVFKLLKGKIKSMTECKEAGAQIDPTPNFDTHISKSVQFDVSSVSHMEAYESSQVYLYEYGEFEVEDRPRQLYPYAVIDVRYIGHDAFVKQAPKVARHSGPPSVRPSYPVNHRPQFSPMQQQSPPSRPLLQNPPRPYFRPSPPSPIPSPLAEVQQNSPHCSLVVWTGQLTCNGTFICLVNLLSHTSNGRPARIGAQLSLSKRSPLDVIQARCFLDLQSLPKDQELEHENLYYNYARLLPVKRKDDSFHQIRAFLEHKQSGASVKLEDDCEVMIMPGCILTRCLGLSEDSDHFDGLHCIFISQQSRRMLPSSNNPPPSSDSLPQSNSSASSEKLTVYTPPPSVRSGTPDSVGNAHALDKSAILSALNRDCPSPAPSLSSVSSDLPSPGHPEVRMTPSPLGHSISSLLTPTRPPSDWDEGFQAFIPPGSLIYKGSIVSSFHDQLVLQDRRNIDKAKRPLKLSPRCASAGEGRPPQAPHIPQQQMFPLQPPPPYPNMSYPDTNYLHRTNTWPSSIADTSWQQQTPHYPLVQQTDPRLKRDDVYVAQSQSSNLEQSPSLGRRPGSPPPCPTLKQWTPSPQTPLGVTGSTTPAEGLLDADQVGPLSLLDQRILAFEKGTPDPGLRKADEDRTGFSPDEDRTGFSPDDDRTGFSPDEDEDEEMTDDLADLIVKSVPVNTKRDSFVDPNNLNIKRVRSSEAAMCRHPEEPSNGCLMGHSARLTAPVTESHEPEEEEKGRAEEEHRQEPSLEVQDLSDFEMLNKGKDVVPGTLPTSPPRLPKTLRGRWYAHLESFKTHPSLFSAACQELEPLESILCDTEVRIADDEVHLCMKVNNDSAVKNERTEDASSTEDVVIQDSINAILHKSGSSGVETHSEVEHRLLWHIALHFLLPLNDEHTERHLLDSNGNAMGEVRITPHLSHSCLTLSEHNDSFTHFTVEVPTDCAVSESDAPQHSVVSVDSFTLYEELDIFHSSDIETQTSDFGITIDDYRLLVDDEVSCCQEGRISTWKVHPEGYASVDEEIINAALIEMTPEVDDMTPERSGLFFDAPYSDGLLSTPVVDGEITVCCEADNGVLLQESESVDLSKPETPIPLVLPPIGNDDNQRTEVICEMEEISDAENSVQSSLNSNEADEPALKAFMPCTDDTEIESTLTDIAPTIESTSAPEDAASKEQSTDCNNNEEVGHIVAEQPVLLAEPEELTPPKTAEMIEEDATVEQTKGPFENIDIQLHITSSDVQELTEEKPDESAVQVDKQHYQEDTRKVFVSTTEPSDEPPEGDLRTMLTRLGKEVKDPLSTRHADVLHLCETSEESDSSAWNVVDSVETESLEERKVVLKKECKPQDRLAHRIRVLEKVDKAKSKSKLKSLNNSPFHPYKKRGKRLSPQGRKDRQDLLQQYRTPRDLEDLMGCLTKCNYISTHLPPGGLLAQGIRRKGPAKFTDYTFNRKTPEILDPDEDLEDLPFSKADVPDFESKRCLAKQLDDSLLARSDNQLLRKNGVSCKPYK